MKSFPIAALVGALVLTMPFASAEDAAPTSVVALQRDKAALAGKLVQVEGKVVKVNNGIMGRNFVHVNDGSGDDDSGRVIATSKETAAVGDRVTVAGRVVLDRDFGSGYMYPLLLEDARITPAK